MAIPREAIEKVVKTHPDSALVGVPVSLLREILAILPVATIPPAVWIGVDVIYRDGMNVTEVRTAA